MKKGSLDKLCNHIAARRFSDFYCATFGLWRNVRCLVKEGDPAVIFIVERPVKDTWFYRVEISQKRLSALHLRGPACVRSFKRLKRIIDRAVRRALKRAGKYTP